MAVKIKFGNNVLGPSGDGKGSWGDALSQLYQGARQTGWPGRSRLLKYSPNKEVRPCMTDVILTSKGYHLHAPLSSVCFSLLPGKQCIVICI